MVQGIHVTVVVEPLRTYLYGLPHNGKLTEELREETSYFPLDYKPNEEYKFGYFDGRVHLMAWDSNSNAWTLPTGLLSRVRDILAKNHAILKLDVRIPTWTKDPRLAALQGATPFKEGHENRPHQNTATLALVKPREGRLGGVIQAATGFGKTAVIARTTKIMQVPTLVFVTTADLMYQMQNDLQEFLGIPIGIVGDGKCKPELVTVCIDDAFAAIFGIQTENSKAKTRRVPKEGPAADKFRWMVHNEFKKIDVDEAHHVAADTMYTAIQECTSAIMINGYSASPWRDDGKDLLIEATCGPVVCKIPATDLIRGGYLVQPYITVWQLPGPKVRTMAHLSKKLHEKYRAWIVDNEEYNSFVAERAAHHIAKGRATLVLVKIVEHGKKLAAMIPNSEFVDGAVTPKRRKEYYARIKRGELSCLIATSVADEGLDLPILAAVILAGAGRSSTKALQRIGRCLRLHEGKDGAFVEDFSVDDFMFLRQSRERRRIYHTEPAFVVTVIPITRAPDGKFRWQVPQPLVNVI